MQTLRLHKIFFAKIKQGTKTATARLGRRVIEPGPLLFIATEDAAQTLEVHVTRSYYTTLTKVNEDEAKISGHLDKKTMIQTLQSIYPGIALDDDITMIKFRL